MAVIDLKAYVRTQFQTYLPVIKSVTNSKQSTSEKGAANGYASLGADGKIPNAQVPNIAISDFLGEVADQAAMLALTGQKGDWCTRTDESKDYIAIGDDLTQTSSWRAVTTPNSGVSSFNGRTGAVTPQAGDYNKSDVGLGNVDNTSDADKPISNATQTALNDKANDSAVVHNTGAETVNGVKTFGDFPVTPSSAPATDYQVANKKYVDDQVAAGGGASAINDLTDVDTATNAPTNDQILKWDNTNSLWIPDDAANTTNITSSEATDDWNNA